MLKNIFRRWKACLEAGCRHLEVLELGLNWTAWDKLSLNSRWMFLSCKIKILRQPAQSGHYKMDTLYMLRHKTWANSTALLRWQPYQDLPGRWGVTYWEGSRSTYFYVFPRLITCYSHSLRSVTDEHRLCFGFWFIHLLVRPAISWRRSVYVSEWRQHEQGKRELCCYANVVSKSVIFVIVTDVINLAYLECQVLDADEASC